MTNAPRHVTIPAMDSPAHVNCPHCGQQYTVTPEQMASYTGEPITCSRCGKPFAMAMPPTSPQDAPADAPEAAPVHPAAPGSSSIQYAHAPGASGDGGAARTSGFSITSLVCGCLLCIPLLTGVLAIVFGVLGLRQSKRNERVGGKGLAIAGIVLGIVNVLFYIGYFVLIYALTVPLSRNAQQMANQAVCRNNLRQIATAIGSYASTNNGAYPADLKQLVSSNLLPGTSLTCPSLPSTGPTPWYTYVGAGQTASADPDTIILYEPLTNHPTGTHILTADQLVQFLPTEQAKAKLKEQGIEVEENVDVGK